jgi:hypothetical protein
MTTDATMIRDGGELQLPLCRSLAGVNSRSKLVRSPTAHRAFDSGIISHYCLNTQFAAAFAMHDCMTAVVSSFVVLENRLYTIYTTLTFIYYLHYII